MEATNRLAAGVAHEFNNVLQIVYGYVMFAREGLPDESDTRRDLTCALEAADRAASLSSRLLQLVRADENHEGPADVNDAVDSLQLLLKPILGCAVNVEVDADGELPLAAAADGLLRQALLNLCVNAGDAMPEGGAIRLVTRAVEFIEPEACSVGSVEAGNYIGVAVEDEGEGVSEEAMGQLFDPFFTTKDVGKGAGLGLSMVASFVAGSGGGLRYSNRPQGGATFELFLPVWDEAKGQAGFDPSELLGGVTPL